MNEGSKRVIIADDHASSVMYLAVLMRRMGFQVVPAQNGVEVLKLMKLAPPDLVILDYTMPVMDGLTALRHITSDSQLKDIPVIMVTAHSHRGGADDFRKLGAFGYITKPINIKNLHALLQECITYSGGRKREHLRTALHKSVSVMFHGMTKTYFAMTLSEKGVYLRAKDPLPIGSELGITLPLLPGQILSLKGKVIYHKDIFSDAIDPGMAVEFTEIPDADARTLNAYISNTLAGDLLAEQDEWIISLNG